MGIPASSTSAIAVTDAIVDNLHDTDIPAIKTVVDGVETHVHSIETKLDATIVTVNDLHGTDIPDIHTDVADIHTDVADLHTDLTTVDGLVDGISLNRMRVLQVTVTKAANAGSATLATVTSSVTIEDIIVKMVTYHADLTSIDVTGATVIDFIDSTEGAAANLNAADKQVAWSGVAELGDAKTLAINYAGTNSGSVSTLVTIRYRPNTLTGALA